MTCLRNLGRASCIKQWDAADDTGSLAAGAVATAVTYDRAIKALHVRVPGSGEEFWLHPATVRRNDRSAQSIVRQAPL